MRKLIDEYLLTIVSYVCVLFAIMMVLTLLKSSGFIEYIMKGAYGI